MRKEIQGRNRASGSQSCGTSDINSFVYISYLNPPNYAYISRYFHTRGGETIVIQNRGYLKLQI